MLAAANAMFWVTEPDCPSLLSSVASSVYNNKLVVFGRDGLGTAQSARVPRYDLLAQTWDYAANRPLGGNHHCAMQVGNLMYVVGGRWSGSAGALQVYNWDTNTWKVLAPFNTDGTWAAGALSCGHINGKIVIAGGEQEGELIAYPYTACTTSPATPGT